MLENSDLLRLAEPRSGARVCDSQQPHRSERFAMIDVLRPPRRCGSQRRAPVGVSGYAALEWVIQSDSPKAGSPSRVPAGPVKILVLTNLYPPHHAGTYDLRCQSVSELLRLRGHTVLVLTSNHGLNTEQRDEETHRRLVLNGAYGHPLVSGLRELQKLEERNHLVLSEAIAESEPDLVYIWSLIGLSK